jgi:hypothetical protein
MPFDETKLEAARRKPPISLQTRRGCAGMKLDRLERIEFEVARPRPEIAEQGLRKRNDAAVYYS